jgi:hypothetical protein
MNKSYDDYTPLVVPRVWLKIPRVLIRDEHAPFTEQHWRTLVAFTRQLPPEELNSKSYEGASCGTANALDYAPLVGPSVWLKIPNRDPKRPGSLQRVDRINLEKFKARITLAEERLAKLEAEERERERQKQLAELVEKRRQAELARKRYVTVGTRVSVEETYGRDRVLGTVVSPAAARVLSPLTQSGTGDLSRFTYILVDGGRVIYVPHERVTLL